MFSFFSLIQLVQFDHGSQLCIHSQFPFCSYKLSWWVHFLKFDHETQKLLQDRHAIPHVRRFLSRPLWQRFCKKINVCEKNLKNIWKSRTLRHPSLKSRACPSQLRAPAKPWALGLVIWCHVMSFDDIPCLTVSHFHSLQPSPWKNSCSHALLNPFKVPVSLPMILRLRLLRKLQVDVFHSVRT